MDRFSNINMILAFVTVAKEGSVSRAAEVLHLTQPAISHQIKRLGQETGITLFTRTATGLQITKDGAALLGKAEKVLNAMAEFRRTASQRLGQVSGKLRIGTIVDPEFIRLGRMLGQLRTDYPDIEPELRQGVSGDVLMWLERGQVDAGFYLSDIDGIANLSSTGTQFHALQLARFTYRVIAPVGWQGRLNGADWPALAELPWIGTPPSSVHNRLLKTIFGATGCTPNIVTLVDQESSMLEMVRSGIGLSLCRDSIALHQKQTYGLAVSDVVSVPACLGFVTLDKNRSNPAVSALFDVLKDAWQ